LFDVSGKIENEPTLELLVKFIDAFTAWVEKNSSKTMNNVQG